MRQGRPSYTARKVAINVVMLGASEHGARLLPVGCAEATERLLVASGEVNPTTLKLAKRPSMRRLQASMDWMMPGQFEGFALRKRFCEREVRRAVAEGARQVLVLGAGYDTLAFRLAGELDAQFFEIDHPATAAVKRRGLEAMGIPRGLHLIAEDLAQRSLESVLRDEPAWDARADAIVVAEGLLMYLPPEAVRTLFDEVKAQAGPASRVAFSYVGRRHGQPDAGPLSPLVLWTLRVSGEPWLWGIDPPELPRFLERLGWRQLPSADGATRCGIEHLAVATLAREPDSADDGAA